MTGIRIPGWLAGRLVAVALREYPREMCGVLAGPPGAIIDRWVEFRNIHPQPQLHFAVDTAAQLQAWARLEAAGVAPVATVHSHTSGLDRPSEEDQERHDPNLLMLLVHVAIPYRPRILAFQHEQGTGWRGVGVTVLPPPSIDDDPWLWRHEQGEPS